MKVRPGAFLWIAGMLAAALLIGLAVSSFLDLRNDFDRADALAAARAHDVEALRSQLIALGETPDVETPARGETGEQGPPGEDGQDGEDATFDQIAAAVASWFFANPPVDQPDPDDPEIQDPEIQDDEVQDAEIQDPEVQDPEVDDPDPDSPPCPSGYSLQPDVIRGDEVLLCTRDPQPPEETP
jgi:hypothetical protein